MPVKQAKKAPPKGRRFSKTAQPTKRRAKAAPKVARPGVLDVRQVETMASQGAESSDIAIHTGLVSRLQSEPATKAVFEAAVGRGQAALRIGVAKILCDQGLEKRQTQPLIELARTLLSRYLEDDRYGPEEENALRVRVDAELERLKKARKRNAAA